MNINLRSTASSIYIFLVIERYWVTMVVREPILFLKFCSAVVSNCSKQSWQSNTLIAINKS